MQALSGGPTTPIEQVTELGDGILQKLVAAGITTVEALADMTPEELEEIPGIGEKTLERISVAVRHYFGHFEEGEGGPAAEEAAAAGAQEAVDAGEPAAEGAVAVVEAAEQPHGEEPLETAEVEDTLAPEAEGAPDQDDLVHEIQDEAASEEAAAEDQEDEAAG